MNLDCCLRPSHNVPIKDKAIPVLFVITKTYGVLDKKYNHEKPFFFLAFKMHIM